MPEARRPLEVPDGGSPIPERSTTMTATSKKLTVREVQDRVKKILARRVISDGKSSWPDPEGVQGLIDDLREDVIQAIAAGSKVPYALTRCIAELPRVHYGTIPDEPTRTTVTKVAASSLYGKIGNNGHRLLKTESEMQDEKNSTSRGMSSEQYYAIREYLMPESDEPSDKYPPGMSPRNLREAFDELVRMHEKRKAATERIVEAANTFLETCKSVSG
jgi:hypothetical protein